MHSREDRTRSLRSPSRGGQRRQPAVARKHRGATPRSEWPTVDGLERSRDPDAMERRWLETAIATKLVTPTGDDTVVEPS